jgi:hypothetical protein
MERAEQLPFSVEQPVPPVPLQRPEHQPRRRRLTCTTLRIQV